VLDQFGEDMEFWLEEARAARGPVLEIGCGTGRVLLALLEHGIDAEGIDNAPAMLERLRAKAAERGLEARVTRGDMRDFSIERRFARVIIPFNGFAHCDTTAEQLDCLRCCRQHLAPGGAFVIHMSYPSADYWS